MRPVYLHALACRKLTCRIWLCSFRTFGQGACIYGKVTSRMNDMNGTLATASTKKNDLPVPHVWNQDSSIPDVHSIWGFQIVRSCSGTGNIRGQRMVDSWFIWPWGLIGYTKKRSSQAGSAVGSSWRLSWNVCLKSKAPLSPKNLREIHLNYSKFTHAQKGRKVHFNSNVKLESDL